MAGEAGMIGRRTLFGTGLAAGLAAVALPVRAAPRAELWERWLAHDPGSARSVDHGAFADLLAARLITEAPDGIHRFAYGAVTETERAGLDRYIATLEASPVAALNRAEQFAFWANLYNAVTLRTVLDAYPVDSIRDIDISPGLFANGPWGAELAAVDGVALTLDDIEHRILRPIWGDERVHYAVNCAALGCPNLNPQPWRAETLDADLDRAARAFVNHPRGATIDERGRLRVSSIYDWFEADFGGTEVGVIAHLRRHADPALAARLAEIDGIAGDDYDWVLNDAR